MRWKSGGTDSRLETKNDSRVLISGSRGVRYNGGGEKDVRGVDIVAKHVATVSGLIYQSSMTQFTVRTGPGTNFSQAPFKARIGMADLPVLDIQPDSAGNASCHTITVYQNGEYLGESYYSGILMPDE